MCSECLVRLQGAGIWGATSPGAYEFLVLYTSKFDVRDVFIVSRTNTGSWYSHHQRLGTVEAWIVRFVRGCGLLQLGFDINNLMICSAHYGDTGKGVLAKRVGLTHMIDNDLNNLRSVLFDEMGNAMESVERYNGKVIRRSGTSLNCLPKSAQVEE